MTPEGTIQPPTVHVALVVLRMDTGGTERYIANIANGLSGNGFQISIICLDRSGSAAHWITQPDVNIYELHLPGGNNWSTVRGLVATLQNLRPSIVHSHNWGTLVETYLAARRVPNVQHIHAERGTVLGTNQCGPIKKKLRAWVMRWICARVAAVTTNAHCVARQVALITGIASAKLHVIPNGVAPAYPIEEAADLRATIRREVGLEATDFVIGSVGRLAEVKNFALGIRALSRLHASGPLRPHLLLVGDGPQRETLMQVSRECNLERYVHFVGHRQNASRYLAAMELFINTSISEGMSQSLLEAMSVGLPVVATNVGDAKVIVDTSPPCGIVVPSGDEAALANAVEKLATPGTHEVFSENARNRQLLEYTYEKMVYRYAELYRSVAGFI